MTKTLMSKAPVSLQRSMVSFYPLRPKPGW